MATFLDQKEEVMRLELTPYGKEKFSKGEFSPAYYAFYDNDILYDVSYAPFSGTSGRMGETQNNIATRILTKTPRFGPLTRFSSNVSPVVTLKSLDHSNEFYQDKAYTAPFNRYIGDSSPWSDYVPSWHITVSPHSDVSLTDTTRYRSSQSVPVVTASLLLEYETQNISDNEDPNLMFMLKKNENITLDVQEVNTLFKLNGNFDIEIFKIDESERLLSLGFINPHNEGAQNLYYQAEAGILANNILGMDEEIANAYPVLDEGYVEYFLDIRVDNEVPGVEMPSHTTIYRQNIDRTPTNLCSIIDEIGSAEDWGY